MKQGAGEPGRPDDSLSEVIIGACIEIHRYLGSLHVAQLLTYLKLTEREVGLLINFNVPLLRQGIRRLTRRKNSSELPGSPTPRRGGVASSH